MITHVKTDWTVVSFDWNSFLSFFALSDTIVKSIRFSAVGSTSLGFPSFSNGSTDSSSWIFDCIVAVRKRKDEESNRDQLRFRSRLDQE